MLETDAYIQVPVQALPKKSKKKVKKKRKKERKKERKETERGEVQCCKDIEDPRRCCITMVPDESGVIPP
jgi:hypothetical protein